MELRRQMTETSGRILKSDDVELQGQYHLGLAPDEFKPSEPAQTNAIMAAPEARIVENHADHAVIEVACSCGTKVHLRCDYAGAQTPENS
jgi:hypothetical protein